MVGHALSSVSPALWGNGSLLRRVLLIDAVASGVGALPLLIGVEWLSPHLGLPLAFLRPVGMVLVPWVALLVLVAARSRRSSVAIWSVIATNLLWVVASAGLLVSDVVSPTPLGIAVVIVQAAFVIGFASLQYLGWSRDR